MAHILIFLREDWWSLSGQTVPWCFLLQQPSLLLIAVSLLADSPLGWLIAAQSSNRSKTSALQDFGLTKQSWGLVCQLGFNWLLELIRCPGTAAGSYGLTITGASFFEAELRMPYDGNNSSSCCCQSWKCSDAYFCSLQNNIRAARKQQSRKLCLCGRHEEMQLRSRCKRQQKQFHKSSRDGAKSWSWGKSAWCPASPPSPCFQKKPTSSHCGCW